MDVTHSMPDLEGELSVVDISVGVVPDGRSSEGFHYGDFASVPAIRSASTSTRRCGQVHRSVGEGGPRRELNDCSARCDLDGGDAPAVQHHQAVPVPRAQDAAVLGQCGHYVVDYLFLIDPLGGLECDIHPIAADKPDP